MLAFTILLGQTESLKRLSHHHASHQMRCWWQTSEWSSPPLAKAHACSLAPEETKRHFDQIEKLNVSATSTPNVLLVRDFRMKPRPLSLIHIQIFNYHIFGRRFPSISINLQMQQNLPRRSTPTPLLPQKWTQRGYLSNDWASFFIVLWFLRLKLAP